MEKKSKDKVGSFKKTHKFDKHLQSWLRENREDINEELFNDFEVQCELYANKVDKVDKMDESLEKCIFKNWRWKTWIIL